MNQSPVTQPTDDAYARAGNAISAAIFASIPMMFFLGLVVGHYWWHQ